MMTAPTLSLCPSARTTRRPIQRLPGVAPNVASVIVKYRNASAASHGQGITVSVE